MLATLNDSAADVFVRTLRAKLVYSQMISDPPDKFTNIARLAVVDVRLCLDYETQVEDNKAMQTAVDLVATHMRTVYSIPQHRQYLYSGYSSEPLLAEVSSSRLLTSYRTP